MKAVPWRLVDGPGFWPDLDAESYLRDPAPLPSLNQSLIPYLLEASPRHAAYNHPRLNPYGRAVEGSKATYLGSAVHRLALGKGREISTIRFPDYKSSSARAARDAALANNRIPILERELAGAQAMADEIRARIEETLGGAPFETELPIVWIEETPFGPIYCRAMLDVWCEALAREVDVKTTRGLATEAFAGRDMASNGYDVQRRFYARGVAKLRPDLAGRIRTSTLYVENRAPYGARAFRLDGMSAEIADRKVEAAILKFAECFHARKWPGYPPGEGVVSTPTYYQNEWANRELAEEIQ